MRSAPIPGCGDIATTGRCWTRRRETSTPSPSPPRSQPRRRGAPGPTGRQARLLPEAAGRPRRGARAHAGGGPPSPSRRPRWVTGAHLRRDAHHAGVGGGRCHRPGARGPLLHEPPPSGRRPPQPRPTTSRQLDWNLARPRAGAALRPGLCPFQLVGLRHRRPGSMACHGMDAAFWAFDLGFPHSGGAGDLQTLYPRQPKPPASPMTSRQGESWPHHRVLAGRRGPSGPPGPRSAGLNWPPREEMGGQMSGAGRAGRSWPASTESAGAGCRQGRRTQGYAAAPGEVPSARSGVAGCHPLGGQANSTFHARPTHRDGAARLPRIRLASRW